MHRLRPLDIQPTSHRGQPSLLLRDPLELSGGQYLIAPQALGPALMLLDGEHDADAIYAELTGRWNLRLERELVDELIEALDEALFLDNARAAAGMAAALAAYRAAPFRPPIGAGQSYPDDPRELRILLDGYLADVGEVEAMPASGRALISPHIDFPRGGRVYAKVWKQAQTLAEAADLVIVLGTDHYAGYNRLTLTRQHYATPYGPLPTDVALVEALAEEIGREQCFAGELYHSREHSIELVVTWLHHMRGGRPVALLPILTGSFQPFLANGGAPEQDPLFGGLLHSLKTLTAGRNVLFVASGDLAHIGPAFGGDPVGIIERADLRAHDEELLAHLAAGDADGFWRFIRSVEDGKNVCGVSPFYLTLKLAGAVEGRRAGYAVCPADERNTSVVSVCGMVFG